MSEEKTSHKDFKEFRKAQKEAGPKIPKNLLPYWDDLKLLYREQEFVFHYCNNGFNQTRAVLSCRADKNKTYEAAAFKACTLLKKQKIREAVKRYLEEFLSVKRDRLETELFDLYFIRATYDPGDIIRADGELVVDDLKKLPGLLSRCVEGIEVKYHGANAAKKTVMVKLANREKAQEQLCKYIRMIKGDDNTPSTLLLSEETEKKLKSIFDKVYSKGEGNAQ